MRIILSLLLFSVPAVAQDWNAEYMMWQRGEHFVLDGHGTPTADRTKNGPGLGATMAVSRLTLTPTQRAAIPGAPRWGKRMEWIVAPTGPGETLRVDYPDYGSYEEMWEDDVLATAGQPFTVGVCAWTDEGEMPFYIYLSQWTGDQGHDARHGTGNTIVGESAGTDHNSYHQEVMNRSHQMVMTSQPQCFQYTFPRLDDMVGSTVAAGNSIIYGLGFDWPDIEAGDVVNVTLLRGEVGEALPAWHRLSDALVATLAQYNYRRVGVGMTGFVMTPTSVLLQIPPGPVKDHDTHNGMPRLLCANPILAIPGEQNIQPTDATIVQWELGAGGGYVVIDGFSGLTVGRNVMFGGNCMSGPSDLIEIVYSMDWPPSGTRWQP